MRSVLEQALFHQYKITKPIRLIDGKFIPLRCIRLDSIGLPVATTVISHYAGGACGDNDNLVIDKDTSHSIVCPKAPDVSKAGDIDSMGYSRRLKDFIRRFEAIPDDERLKDYYVRSLTALECYRLMGVKDEDAEKMINVNTTTVCRKQAGNSILVPILMNVFKQLIKQ